MDKSALQLAPSYFDTYIAQAPDLPIRQGLKSNGLPLIEYHRDTWSQMGSYRYAPGKWTINEIIQHIIDTERVFSYRALRIARGDATPMPGFDQDVFNEYVAANDRRIADLLKELIVVRQSTIWLYDSISDDALLRQGTASGLTMNPLALGFMIIGHLIHHIGILEERYYPHLKKK